MSQLPKIHLCIQQPLGYVHSLGLLDQARYFRYQFRRLGAEVSLAKNRLRHDAVNFVFGAHLGFDAALRERFACIFVNLEQLGHGGAVVVGRLPAPARRFGGGRLRPGEPRRLREARRRRDDRAAAARALPRAGRRLPLEERPIDLLFFGSMNPRRRALLDRIEAPASTSRRSTTPLYGPERDDCIRPGQGGGQRHFYESSRFEQAPRRPLPVARHAGDLPSTPSAPQPAPGVRGLRVLARRRPGRGVVRQDFGTPAFYDESRAPRCSASPSTIRSRPTPTCWPSPAASAGAARIAPAAAPWQPDARSTSARARTTRAAGSTSTSSTAPSPTWCSTSPAG